MMDADRFTKPAPHPSPEYMREFWRLFYQWYGKTYETTEDAATAFKAISDELKQIRKSLGGGEG